MKAIIPAELIVPIMDDYLSRRGISQIELSTQLGYSTKGISAAVENGYFSFALADLILCKCNQVQLWWVEPLRTWYDACFQKKCKRAKCRKLFLPASERQLYCTPRCRKYAARDRWNARHKARVRANNASRMRALRRGENLTVEEIEYRRLQNRLSKRRQRARQKEAA